MPNSAGFALWYGTPPARRFVSMSSRSQLSGPGIQAHALEITDDRAPGYRGGGQALSFGLTSSSRRTSVQRKVTKSSARRCFMDIAPAARGGAPVQILGFHRGCPLMRLPGQEAERAQWAFGDQCYSKKARQALQAPGTHFPTILRILILLPQIPHNVKHCWTRCGGAKAGLNFGGVNLSKSGASLSVGGRGAPR